MNINKLLVKCYVICMVDKADTKKLFIEYYLRQFTFHDKLNNSQLKVKHKPHTHTQKNAQNYI